MITRRDILRMLASLPLLGSLAPKDAEAETIVSPSTPAQGPYRTPEVKTDLGIDYSQPWQVLAAKLWMNYEQHVEAKPYLRAEPEHLKFMQPLVYRMFQALLHGHDYSHEYFPSQPRDLLKTVRFGVMDRAANLMWTSYGRDVIVEEIPKDLPRPEHRKVRARWTPVLMEDLQTFGVFHPDVDLEVELLQIMGEQLALEIKREIRFDAAAGRMPNLYVFNLPPYRTPSMLDPKDFSVRHSLRMSYSKMHWQR